jgi:hypothetical protein
VSLDAAFNLRAYHRQNGKMEDLNTLVVGDSSLCLLLACSINAAGEITGLAFDTAPKELHGFLAIPSSSRAGGTRRRREPAGGSCGRSPQADSAATEFLAIRQLVNSAEMTAKYNREH